MSFLGKILEALEGRIMEMIAVDRAPFDGDGDGYGYGVCPVRRRNDDCQGTHAAGRGVHGGGPDVAKEPAAR